MRNPWVSPRGTGPPMPPAALRPEHLYKFAGLLFLFALGASRAGLYHMLDYLLVIGVGAFAGAVALSALATGYIASTYSLRPEPFYLGVIFLACGLLLSSFAVKVGVTSRFRPTHVTAKPERSAN